MSPAKQPKARPRRSAGAPATAPAAKAPAAGELLGAHVSIAGGTHEAPPRAGEIGATAMQMFTKMANRWAERTVDDAEARGFRAALAQTPVAVTVVHDSYLINLASPDPALRRRSIESFVAELERCHALGITYLVSHPGNFMDEREAGVQRNADAIAEALERAPGKTVLCMETTAGAGTVIGSTFEELARLLDLVPARLRRRMGVCLDTCHVYSAGYDLVRDFDGVFARFDDVLGADRLRVLHLNDSKTPFDSRRDRHELIGEGTLGPEPFRRIMTGDRFRAVAKVLETPKLDDATKTDRKMLARLREYAAGH
ncbi:MAG TPA: deoxyribonuclease IV [Gemmatimonadaceae bacterium]|nr:deoxyribonuclease IV [Gemmatimonadaceae bacterium]